MRARFKPIFAGAVAVALAASSPERGFAAPQLPAGFLDEPIVTGLHFPACMAFLPDGRVLATQQRNFRVILIDPGPPATTAVIGTIDSVEYKPEGGLLGIAVDPRWPVEPYLYFHYSWSGGPRIHISRYRAVGNLDGTSGGALTLDSLSTYHVIVDLPDSAANHNGGQLHFGPDGMLYATVGDDLRSCHAQSKELLRGKLLRLDVQGLPDGPGGPPPFADITPADNPFVAHPDPRARLVWAYGLRNPYSFSIDAPTEHVVIGDVGAATAEEIDLATQPGLNFGWPLYEGFTPGIPCANADTMGISPEKPLYAYGRPTGVPDPSVSVVTGGMYRPVGGGAASFPPAYDGNIFLSDVTQGFLRRLSFNGVAWQLADPVSGQPSAEDWGRDYDGVTDYAIGPDGALWYAKFAETYLSETGEIRRIYWNGTASVPPPMVPGLQLEPPAPSPAQRRVGLAWTQPRDAIVAMEAFDARGRRVRRIVLATHHGAGRHTAGWDLTRDGGQRVAPGIYFVVLDAGGERASRRVVVLE